MAKLIELQREYFGLLDDIFRRATGTSAAAFAHPRFAELVVPDGPRAQILRDGIEEINQFHKVAAPTFHAAARELGGVKAFLEDKRIFSGQEIRAVTRMALYADTILIPDPVVSWINAPIKDREHHRVWIFEAVWNLLKLKPLVDCNSHIPPIVVLPYSDTNAAPSEDHTIWNVVSEELERAKAFVRLDGHPDYLRDHKSLTKEATATLQIERESSRNLDQLCTEACSSILGQQFSSLDEVQADWPKFIHKKFGEGLYGNGKFYMASDNPRPNDDFPERQDSQLDNAQDEVDFAYEGLIHTSDRERRQAWSDQERAHNRIQSSFLIRRVRNHFIRIAQAQSLSAHPLLVSQMRAFYFRTIAGFKQAELAGTGVISSKTSSIVQALSQERFAWLSNVPLNAVAEMRANNENEKLRDRLSKATSDFSSMATDDLDRVTNEISRSLAGILNDHQREALEIEEKYQAKYSGLAVKGWLSASALIVPHIAPMFPAASLISAVPAVMLAGKYAQTKIEESNEKKKLSLSLLGLIAHAEENTQH